MPSLVIFGRRTLMGGDDLQPGCFITIIMRIFQIFVLLLPVFIHILKEGLAYGASAYFLRPIYDSLECRRSFLFPLFTLIYCFVSAGYFISSIVVEGRLWKASNVGTPTESHLRNERVVQMMEIKTISLNCFLVTNFGVGAFAISRSKLFYRCLKEYEHEYNIFYDDVNAGLDDQLMSYQNITETHQLRLHDPWNPSNIFSGTRTWWFFFWVLMITQGMEIIYSIVSLVRLFRKPKGMHIHPTLEDFLRSGGNHSHYIENYHYSEQDHTGLYDALWEERCKFWCKCSGQATCFLFGGREVGSGDYTDISRVLTDYFEHGGTLDIVPSDIAAAFIVLQKIQKHRMHSSRQSIIESRRNIMESMSLSIDSTNHSTRSQSDLEVISPDEELIARIPSNISSKSLPSYTIDIESPQTPSLYRKSNFGINPPSILIRDRRTDREIIGEGARFARHALAIYTWMLYVYMRPMCGFCQLGCINLKACKKRSFQYGEKSSHNDVDSHVATIIGDNCCHMHKRALLQQSGLDDSELIYAQFENGLKKTPYSIVLDHKWKSVVLAIRGTLSLEDCVMDVLVGSKPLNDLGKRYGFDGDGEFIHCGILETTEWIMDDLNKHKTLEHLLLGTSAAYSTYKLRIVGHSLGAGCATLLSLMLRKTYPTLRCLAYSPPGGFCTKRTATGCKQFVTSFVLDADLVPRLSIENMEHLRNEILSLIGKIRVPKVEVLRSLFNSNINESIQMLLYPDQSHISDTEYANQLQKFQQIQEERKQQRGRVDVRMYPPGKIIHLVKTSEKESRCGQISRCGNSFFKSSNNVESCYTPCWADNGDFNEIVVMPSMGTDHFPSNVCLELENIAIYFGIDVSLGSSKEDLND